MEIQKYLSEQKERVETALKLYIPAPVVPFTRHIESMRYSVFAGGKRIRPILCLAAAETIRAKGEIGDSLLPVACALECIHTYSLIHDDLPAMDNDELRRGKPTNHVLYGEAEAILAGDGLLTLAFELITTDDGQGLSAVQRLDIAQIIARAAGSFGMVGGQFLDIANENSQYPFEMLQMIHRRKTGALITASVQAGAIAAGACADDSRALSVYGDEIGLAFQIVDDLLNATSTTEKLGKAAGSDETMGKATYPGYFGIDETRKKAQEATARAKEALCTYGENAEPLRSLAEYLFKRTY